VVSATAEELRALFAPRHVAIIGASRTPGKNGHSALRNLVSGGFSGKIFPVNPSGGEIEGLPAYRSIRELPQAADCAMLIVPAAQCLGALEECAARGVKSAVIGASGFAEDGTDEGRARQAALVSVARDAGMRLIGPNTNGIYNRSANLSLGYNAAHGYHMPLAPVSIVAHSGAVFAGIARTLLRHQCGLAKFVPVGNEADLDMLDVLDFLIEDADTQVIGLVIEALSDGERFCRLAQKAADHAKKIVALKIGRSAAGVGAALAHSSRLAGSARAYDAMFEACAVANVRSVEALAGACAFLAHQSADARSADRRVICVSSSGAGGAILADHAAERGLVLAGEADGAWPQDVRDEIARLDLRGTIRNPVDLGSLADVDDLDAIYRILERRGLTGPTVGFAHLLPSSEMDRKVLAAYAARRDRTNSPMLVIAPGGIGDDLEDAYREAGIFICHETALGFEIFAAFSATAARPATRMTDNSSLAKLAVGRIPSVRERTPLTEIESAAILRDCNVPLVTSRAATTLEDACAAIAATGFPAVLKAVVPGIAHKHAMGLVVTGIEDMAALEKAYGQLRERMAGHCAGGMLIVQPMIASRFELIVGISREARLGHFFVIGVGGVHAEAFGDVLLLPATLDRQELRSRIAGSRFGRLLTLFDRSDRPPLVDQLMMVLIALQGLVRTSGEIESAELNPLLVTPGGELRAVDALIVLNTPDAPRQAIS
jgi:acyl-CoA synthetase (NDP forming)